MDQGYNPMNGPEEGRQEWTQVRQENWSGANSNNTKRPAELATASMVLGIIGIVTSCGCCIGIFFSSLALIFGLLTKTEPEWDKNAKIGVITGSIGLGLSVILTVAWFIFASSENPDTLELFRLAAVLGGCL